MLRTDGEVKQAAILATEKASGNETVSYLQAWRTKRAMEAEAKNARWIDTGRYATPPAQRSGVRTNERGPFGFLSIEDFRQPSSPCRFCNIPAVIPSRDLRILAVSHPILIRPESGEH